MRTVSEAGRLWRSFVAIGDSFTEGLSDVLGPDGRHVGWADRTAQGLADAQNAPLDYANLAVRGRLMTQVAQEQVPAAIAMRPDLVSVAAGVNDAMRRGFDLNAVATALESSVRRIRESGADVLVFAFGNPSRRAGLMSLVADRIAAYRTATLEIARVYDARVVDFWDVAAFDDDAEWDADRLHLSPAGHERAARAALHALGIVDDAWRTPGAPSERPSLPTRIGSHVTWFSGHAAPWFARRLRGSSSGDGVLPKAPTFRVINPR